MGIYQHRYQTAEGGLQKYLKSGNEALKGYLGGFDFGWIAGDPLRNFD